MTAADDDVYFKVSGVATVRWDRNRQIVMVEWAGWADPEEFTDLLDAEIRALKEHGGSRLLADCRLQRVLNPASQEKAHREWLPRALAAGLRRFAVVVPGSMLAAMNLQDLLNRVPRATLDIAYFEGVDDARAWLLRPEPESMR